MNDLNDMRSMNEDIISEIERVREEMRRMMDEMLNKITVRTALMIAISTGLQMTLMIVFHMIR